MEAMRKVMVHVAAGKGVEDARMAVEELFSDYVQFSVVDSTLTVTMDERKAIPSV